MYKNILHVVQIKVLLQKENLPTQDCYMIAYTGLLYWECYMVAI